MPRHTIEDFLRPIGLSHEVIQTRRENLLALLGKDGGGNGYNLHFSTAVYLANVFRCFQAAHNRKTQIHPDEMWAPGLKIFDSLRSVLSHSHLKSSSLKQPLQQEPVFAAIFHDHDPVVGLAALQTDNSLGFCWISHHFRYLSPFRGHFNMEP